jgi:hypothetical protein
MSAAVVALADIAESASTTVSKLAVALDDADMLASNSLIRSPSDVTDALADTVASVCRFLM